MTILRPRCKVHSGEKDPPTKMLLSQMSTIRGAIKKFHNFLHPYLCKKEQCALEDAKICPDYAAIIFLVEKFIFQPLEALRMHKLTLAALLICLWQPFSLSLAALLIVPQRQHNVTLPALLPHLQPLAAAGTTLVTTLLQQ